MANNVQVLLTNYVLAPNTTFDFDIDMATEGIHKLGYEFTCVYQATGSTTGVTLNLLTGPGGPDPLAMVGQAPWNLGIPAVPGGSAVPVYGQNSIATTVSPTAASQGAPQTVITSGYLADIDHAWQDWVKFRFKNTDTVNSVTLSFKATIGNGR